MEIKTALLSVSDKKGIIEFAKELKNLGINIISSGGTAKTLKENGIEATEISSVTGFPEILDGRVKTLNPKIHGGILAIRSKKNHMDELKKHSISQIDMVVVNLYPFEDTSKKFLDTKTSEIPQDVIEDIDIGGVALLRAAGKNFHDVLVVTCPEDYSQVIKNIKEKTIDMNIKRSLAAKAFRHTAYYDSMISRFFTVDKFPDQLSIPLKKVSGLRYGENPHQEASLYINPSENEKAGVITAKPLQGKELSYNNYQDLEAAWNIVSEFEEPACIIIKHANPCGSAAGNNLIDAYKRALACDPVSAFGGIIAVNREIDDTLASEIVKVFTECIIAPSYTQKAKEVFQAKKNLRLLEQPLKEKTVSDELEFKFMRQGMLIQDRDAKLLNDIKTATTKAPSAAEIDACRFAWKICKHTKSNAIILVKGRQTVGVGAGQMSRIDSLKIAISKMKEVKFDFPANESLVLASDAFFPFPDVVNEAAKIGVKAIIQPGGSINDDKSIAAANEAGIAMVTTGMRHFKH